MFQLQFQNIMVRIPWLLTSILDVSWTKIKASIKAVTEVFFIFDPSTGEFGSVSESYVPPKTTDKRKKRIVCVDFGDAFFLNEFLGRSGIWDVIDRIDYGNLDTLHAMVLFYTLSNLANCNAQTWFEGNIAKDAMILLIYSFI